MSLKHCNCMKNTWLFVLLYIVFMIPTYYMSFSFMLTTVGRFNNFSNLTIVSTKEGFKLSAPNINIRSNNKGFNLETRTNKIHGVNSVHNSTGAVNTGVMGNHMRAMFHYGFPGRRMIISFLLLWVLSIILIVITYFRGRAIKKKWLVVFPVIALVFNIFLCFIPLVVTVMNLLAIILGSIKNKKTIIK